MSEELETITLDDGLDYIVTDEFEIDGVKLICLQDNSTTPFCKNCYFYYKKEKPCSQILCADYERKDAINVYFKEIKE